MPEALCFCPFPAVRIRTQAKTSTMSLSQYFGRCTYIAFCCGQRKHGKRFIVSLPGINLSRIVWSRFFGRARVTPRRSTPSPHANAKRSRSHRLSPEDIETQWSPNTQCKLQQTLRPIPSSVVSMQTSGSSSHGHRARWSMIYETYGLPIVHLPR